MLLTASIVRSPRFLPTAHHPPINVCPVAVKLPWRTPSDVAPATPAGIPTLSTGWTLIF